MSQEENQFIDVDFQDIQNEIYLTAPQLAQKINDTDIRVRVWADAFGDLIGIERVNGRKKYKESDVPKFAFIKDLIDNKKLMHEQIRKYISKHGFKYAEFDSGLVDPKDPLGFQALASALSVEVDAKLERFSESFLTNISEKLDVFLSMQAQMNIETKAEIESSVEEKVSRIENAVSDILKYNINELKTHIDNKEMESTNKLVEMSDRFYRSMEEQKRKNQDEEQQKNKSFFGRLFKK